MTALNALLSADLRDLFPSESAEEEIDHALEMARTSYYYSKVKDTHEHRSTGM